MTVPLAVRDGDEIRHCGSPAAASAEAAFVTTAEGYGIRGMARGGDPGGVPLGGDEGNTVVEAPSFVDAKVRVGGGDAPNPNLTELSMLATTGLMTGPSLRTAGALPTSAADMLGRRALRWRRGSLARAATLRATLVS